LLALLTPTELAELDCLLSARPSEAEILESIPFSVRMAMVLAARKHFNETGMVPSDHQHRVALTVLDLPDLVKRQVLDAYECGYWRGDPAPEIVPEAEFTKLVTWFNENFDRLLALPEPEQFVPSECWGTDFHHLQDAAEEGPRGAWAAEFVVIVRSLQSRFGGEVPLLPRPDDEAEPSHMPRAADGTGAVSPGGLSGEGDTAEDVQTLTAQQGMPPDPILQPRPRRGDDLFGVPARCWRSLT
jgi:hypothetical protein